jgi:NitT/TauT family transport system substrate-binding protein
MRMQKITPTYVNQGFDVQPFVDDKIKIASAMLYNEYNLILEKGVKEEELNVFNLNDNGVKFPEDSLFTSNESIKNKPEMVKKFVAATVKGWNYAVKNVDETVGIVMKEAEIAGVETSKDHQMKMMNVIAKQIVDNNGNVTGNLSESDFNFVYDSLKENKLLGDKEVSYSTFFNSTK